jgi:hypothetical protein
VLQAANGSSKAAQVTTVGSPGGSKGAAGPAGSPSAPAAPAAPTTSVPTAGNVTRDEDFESVLEHGLTVMAKEVSERASRPASSSTVAWVQRAGVQTSNQLWSTLKQSRRT